MGCAGMEDWIGDAGVFVTPNPSPANAAFLLRVLVGWFDALADFWSPVRGEGCEVSTILVDTKITFFP